MPAILEPILHLQRLPDGTVRVDFSYLAYFYSYEREFTKLGMVFEDEVQIIGVDPPPSWTDRILIHWVGQIFGVTFAHVPMMKLRQFSWTVPRARLDEDAQPNVGPDVDPDEIRCRVEIRTYMPAVWAYSNEEVLGPQPTVEEIEAAEYQKDEVIIIE